MHRSALRTFLIERWIPGAGKLTPRQLQAVSQKSCGVLDQMGPKIQWRHSYVTADAVFCIYEAASEELVREHARRGGFPADRVIAVIGTISPATAKGGAATA